MPTFSKAAVLLISMMFFSGITAPPPNRDPLSSRDNEHPIVVTVQRVRGRLKIELQSNPAPTNDVLRGLQLLFDKYGPDYPVVALIDEANARVTDFSIVPGFAGKVQFRNIHTFVADYQRGTMNELQFCSGQPISKTPSLNSACNSSK